jgi:hypothetical protein
VVVLVASFAAKTTARLVWERKDTWERTGCIRLRIDPVSPGHGRNGVIQIFASTPQS